MKLEASDIVRAMGFEMWYNHNTGSYDIKTPCGEIVHKGDMCEEERDAQEFFFKLAREVFLK